MHETNPNTTSGLMTVKQASEFLTLGRTAFYALIKSGKIPRPIKLGPKGGSSRWRRADLSAFVESLSK